MFTNEKKREITSCVFRQFPDAGMYRVTRVTEWLETNGYSLPDMGYSSFGDFARDIPELFAFPKFDDGTYIIILRDSFEERSAPAGHPADSFFGSTSLVLNDDIIEMSQQSLYALTKVLANGMSVQEMKQRVYDCFAAAKDAGTLNFFAERYTFPVDYCADGFLVNGIITKNISLRGKSLYFSFEKTSIFRDGGAPEVFRPSEEEKKISEEDRAEVYRLLTSHFPFDVPQHMAAVSKLLTDNNVDRIKYGCFKMKDLLARMDFLELEDVVLGGVPQIMVTVRRCDELPEGEPEVSSRYAAEPVYISSQRSVQAESGSVPEGPLEDFCNLPPKPILILMKYLQPRRIFLGQQEMRAELSEDFDKARAQGKIRFYENKMIFPLRHLKNDGQPVEITLKPSTYEGKPWFLSYVDIICRDAVPRCTQPGRQLENFAFLGSWSSFLSELAEKALPEEWDFADSPVKDLHILIQYIKYTFYRLTRENKVCISYDRQFAAFNTGLVDEHYDDIYACFVPNDPGAETKWKFSSFCTAVSRGVGKLLVNYFNPLPEPPCYFVSGDELLFDLGKPLHTDFEHIIIDNVNRLPTAFLEEQFTDFPEALEIVNRLEGADRRSAGELYDSLRVILTDNSRLFVRIQNRIKDSIELCRKRIRWNYKTAVPSYFPGKNTLSLMLPLCLVEESKPDVVLVVELTQAGNYRGQTILTMPQAYIDARLLCRPDSDWLTTVSSGDLFDAEEENTETVDS